MATERRGLSVSEATPVLPAEGVKATPAAAQASHPWWWYMSPAGISNEVRYRQTQQLRINKGYTYAGRVGLMNLYRGPNGKITSGPLPTQKDILYGAAVKPVVTGALLATNLVQRATNGFKPADPNSSPVGRGITSTDRGIKTALGIKQDEQRLPEDLGLQQLSSDLSTGILGGYGGHLAIGANAFTKGAFAALHPGVQQALRWSAGTGIESSISTLLTDNRLGNAANLFGPNTPGAVQPSDDMVSAAGKSLLPNAVAEAAASLGFLAVGKGLKNVGRRLKEGRVMDEVRKARSWAAENGLQTEVDDGHEFTPEAQKPGPAPAAAAPAAPEAPAAAAPAAPEAPAAPATAKAAEDQLLGPEEPPAYDPQAPEIDTAIHAADQLDDDHLKAAAQGGGPVLTELENQLTNQQDNYQPQPTQSVEQVSAPSRNLADPVVPYEAQWQQLPNNSLLSFASPDNNPDLFQAIQSQTGRDYQEFTRQDVLDGLKTLQANGVTVLPSRLQPGQSSTDVGSLSVDPPRFQYKDNVNAQGQQAGGSLDGVTKWNTDLEQVNLIWNDPQDGQTYIVNGHNSLAKAKELGVRSIQTKEILANTAEEARTVGAKANIASGAGTAFDAAKIIRQEGIQDAAGLDAAGIPLKAGQGEKSLGVQGLALSKLPDGLFQQAINSELALGRALALGGSGLDPADMIRIAGLGAKKDISERGFAELVQMAASAPKAADGPQGGIPGMDEWMQDSSVLQKAELSAKVRAELISNKNLFGRVGKSKATQALAEKGGTQVNQGQVMTAADVARGVLDEFDRDKYLAGTPISELLNQGASDIASGAKPDAIKKRILQQLEQAAEAAPPAIKPEEPAPAPVEPVDAPLLPEQRNELKKQLIKKAIQNGEVRPSALPIPELPDGPRNLSDPALAMEDELRLAEEYGRRDAIREQVELEAARKRMGWDDMTLDQKKANGMLDGWKEDPKAPPEPPANSVAGKQKAKEIADLAERIRFTEDERLPSALKRNNGETADLGQPSLVDQLQKALRNWKQQYEELTGNPYARQEPVFTFPADLSKSAPRYGMATVEFGSDLDRAAYMLRDGAKKSKGEDRLISALEAGGYDVAAIRAHGSKVKEAIKQAAGGGAAPQSAMTLSIPDQAFTAPAARAPAAAPAVKLDPNANPERTARQFGSLNNGKGKWGVNEQQWLDTFDRLGGVPDWFDLVGGKANWEKLMQGQEMPELEGRIKALAQGPAASPQSLQSISPPAYFNVGKGNPMIPQTDTYRKELEKFLTTIVRDVAGEDAVVKFEDKMRQVIIPPEWGGDGIATTTSPGAYNYIKDIVTISGLLEKPYHELASTAFHEALHRLQFTRMTLKDMDVFDTVFGKMKIRNYIGGLADKVQTIEAMPVAFQTFVDARMRGVDGLSEAMRQEIVDGLDDQSPRKDGSSWEGTLKAEAYVVIGKVFNGVLEILERINNYAHRRGFTSVNDLFEKAYSSRLAAERAHNRAISAVDPDWKRMNRLAEWSGDPSLSIEWIKLAIEDADGRISALKSQALAGGC